MILVCLSNQSPSGLLTANVAGMSGIPALWGNFLGNALTVTMRGFTDGSLSQSVRLFCYT